MLGHYERLLAGVVAEPDRRLSELSLLGEEERRRVVVEWNRTGREYPGEAGLGELFRAQAERSPDAVAVVYGEERLSYRELEVRSNQLARHLRGLGVGPESRVGLCVERSAGLVVGMLGIVKAGGAYLPLDPSYPTERLGFMLRDGEVEVVVTQESLRSRLPEHVGTGGEPRRGVGGDLAGQRGGAGERGVRGLSGVRDLHVGIDGGAEGGLRDAPGGEPSGVRDGLRRVRGRGGGGAGVERVVRRGDVRDLGSAAARGPGGGDHARGDAAAWRSSCRSCGSTGSPCCS